MSDNKKLYKVVETKVTEIEPSSELTKVYNFDIYTDEDLQINFPKHMHDIAANYIKGYTTKIIYKGEIHRYFSKRNYFWEIEKRTAEDLPKTMLEYETAESKHKNLKKLIQIKTYLETKRPDKWYNKVLFINKTIFSLINEYNDNIIKTFSNKKTEIMSTLVSKICYDLSKLTVNSTVIFDPKRIFETENPKDILEVTSLLSLERDQHNLEYRAANLFPEELTEEQLDELYTDALKYGIVSNLDELGQQHYNIYSRYTKTGFTNEVSYSMVPTNGYFNKEQMSRDYKHATTSSKSTAIKSTQLERLQYATLQEYKKHGEDFLAEGYHVCPKCKKVYHEEDGCPCGYCKPIELTDKDLDKLSYTFDINEIDVDQLIDTIKANKRLSKLLTKHTTFEEFENTLRKINNSKKVSEFVELAETAGLNILKGLKFL